MIVVRCLVFGAWRLTVGASCLLFSVWVSGSCCLLFVCLLFVCVLIVRVLFDCVLFMVCCLLFVVAFCGRSLFVARCVLRVACRVWLVVRCVLLVACCLLLVAC